MIGLSGPDYPVDKLSDNPAPRKLAETALLKRSYILNPDSVFDVLGLVEIATTSPSIICIETS